MGDTIPDLEVLDSKLHCINQAHILESRLIPKLPHPQPLANEATPSEVR